MQGYFHGISNKVFTLFLTLLNTASSFTVKCVTVNFFVHIK